MPVRRTSNQVNKGRTSGSFQKKKKYCCAYHGYIFVCLFFKAIAISLNGKLHSLFSLGIVLADYGPCWREHRRFALTTLRNFGLGKNSMEERIHGEIQYIVKILDDSIGKDNTNTSTTSNSRSDLSLNNKLLHQYMLLPVCFSTICVEYNNNQVYLCMYLFSGKTMSPQLMFHNAASNIICQVLFGTRFEYDDAFIRTFIRCFTENAKLANGPWAMVGDLKYVSEVNRWTLSNKCLLCSFMVICIGFFFSFTDVGFDLVFITMLTMLCLWCFILWSKICFWIQALCLISAAVWFLSICSVLASSLQKGIWEYWGTQLCLKVWLQFLSVNMLLI